MIVWLIVSFYIGALFPISQFEFHSSILKSHAFVVVNTLAFSPSSFLPPFSFSLQTSHNQWKRLFSLTSPLSTPFQVFTFIQFSNSIPAFEYSISPFPLNQVSLLTTNLRAWQGRFDLTPGLFFQVPIGCYVFFSIGETGETGEIKKPEGVIPLSYGLFFDWTYEILFGIGTNETVTWDPDTDSAVISSHLQLVNCSGSSIPVKLSVFPAIFSSFWIDDLLYIPAWMEMSSVTVCLEMDTLYEVYSGSMMTMKVSTDHWSYNVVLNSRFPATLSTFVYSPSLSSLLFSFPSTSHRPVQWQSGKLAGNVIVKQAFLLRLPIATESLEIWDGNIISILYLDFGKNGNVTISGITEVNPPLDINVHCTSSCVIRLLHVVSQHYVTLHISNHTHLSLSSFSFSVITFPREQTLVPLQWNFDSDPISVDTIPTCLTGISFFYHTSQPVLFHLLGDIRQLQRIIHSAILTPSPSNRLSFFTKSLDDVGHVTQLLIRLEPLQRNSHPSVQLSEVRFVCSPNVTQQSLESAIGIKEEFHPIWEKLEKLAKPKEVVNSPIPQFIPKLAKQCPEEYDEKNRILWRRSPAVNYASHRCEDGHRLWRFCTSEGVWNPVEGTCSDTVREILQRTIKRAESKTKKLPDPGDSHQREISLRDESSQLYCPAERTEDAYFPSTAAESWVEVACQSPAFGITRRFCTSSGHWEAPVIPCHHCPFQTFPLTNVTTGNVTCVRAPSGSAFLRGNPLSAVKCYGQFYSEGGATECSVCAGETRGSREHGNIACRHCQNGVLVGMTCVNNTWCKGNGDNVRVGRLVKRPCGQNMRGVVTQLCRPHSGTDGILGPNNDEGCCMCLQRV